MIQIRPVINANEVFVVTRPKPAYDQQGLAGVIVGPGYSSGGYILGCSQCLASCLRHSAQIGPDLLCHPSSVTHVGGGGGSN